MPARPRAAALIVAAGRGVRAGGTVAKQWHPLGGVPVVRRAADAFAAHPGIGEVVVVVPPGAEGRLPGLRCVAGGGSRAESVRRGLAALGPARDVLIHDGARPLVSRAVIDAVLDALATHEAAAPGVPVTDALWRADGDRVTGEADRAGLWRAQTPQGFRLEAIRAAHAAGDATSLDDVAVARAAGLEVRIVAGDERNLKITHPQDFARAEALLRGGEHSMDMRLGHGYDVHRFGPGDHVMLCGVRVPFERSLEGHSDADVGLHALSDAIYGALAEGDIGRHFPPTDPRWKDAESDAFLRHAAGRAAERGYAIGNLDLTLVCERPRIGPLAPAMTARVAEIAGVEEGRVSVKATTSERLGFTGREEGIAAMATAALVGRA